MTAHAQQVNKTDLTERQVSIINQLYCLIGDCSIACRDYSVTREEILEMVVQSHGWEWDDFCKKY